MMKCLECGLHWTPPGGAGGQMIPDCPVCTLRSRLAEAEGALRRARELMEHARDFLAHLGHLSPTLDGIQADPLALAREIDDGLADLATPNTTKPTTEDPT